MAGRDRMHSFDSFFRPPSADPLTPVLVVTILISSWADRLSVDPLRTAGCGGKLVLHALFLGSFPLTTQRSTWYSGLSLAGILLLAAMAFYGFYTSLGGRPVFGGAVLEE